MPRKPLEWWSNDPDNPLNNNPAWTGKGIRLQIWARDPADPEAIIKGLIVTLDSKGKLDKYRQGCDPIEVPVLCDIQCNDCQLDLTPHDMTVPPGTVRIETVVRVEECCLCT